MLLHFTKYQGAGNDFVIIDNSDAELSLEQIIAVTPQLCDRKFGIGADGLMVLQPQSFKEASFEMIYRNADGSDAGMCGNGARCIAHFASNRGYGEQFEFHVHEVIYSAQVQREQNLVDIHFPIKADIKKRKEDSFPEFYQTYTGTDHIVLPLSDVSELNKSDLFDQSRKMRYTEAINPKGTNVNYYVNTSGNGIRLETYERGVEDFTLACGTGAIAAAITFAELNVPDTLENTITVHCAGGDLLVHYEKENQHYSSIILSGPAVEVFHGQTEVNLL
ncbi:diaminopimelate epimerase [bacterium]|nr:MAG: diaminopimelate epimerase [bacterium]